jgi:hypothetical protein
VCNSLLGSSDGTSSTAFNPSYSPMLMEPRYLWVYILALSALSKFPILARFELAAVGKNASKLPCVCECFLPCLWISSSGDLEDTLTAGDAFLAATAGTSVRILGVGREKLVNDPVLEL